MRKDAALVSGDGKACIDAFGKLADPVKAACASCNSSCAGEVAKIVDSQIAAINDACTAAKSVMAERSGEVAGCIGKLTDLDERAKELFGKEKMKLDEELSRDGTQLNLLVSKFAAKCELDAAASTGRTAPSAAEAQAAVAKVRAVIQGCSSDSTAVGCDTASLASLAAEEALAVQTAASLSGTNDAASGTGSLQSSVVVVVVGVAASAFTFALV